MLHLDSERLRAFGDELDALRKRTYARLGEADVSYVRRLNRFSRTMEVVGRALIHFSPEPITFFLGVGALWIHKQLQATEIGHSVLHGAYDRLPGGRAFASKTFKWDTPIDEASWRHGHNVRHHGATNVAGSDADIHFGPVRLTEQTPYNWRHRWQVPVALALLFPNFGFWMNLHFTGALDTFAENGLPEKLDFLPDRSPESRRGAWRKALGKLYPYYTYNYSLPGNSGDSRLR